MTLYIDFQYDLSTVGLKSVPGTILSERWAVARLYLVPDPGLSQIEDL